MGSDQPGEARPTPRPARSLDTTNDGPRPARPASVREGMAEAKPTPVRDGVPPTNGEQEAPAASAQESATLEVDGVTWTVRVLGRGQAGTDTAPAPLLALGFFLDPASAAPEREALVVARGLEGFSPRQLEAAFEASRPPPPPGRRKELFGETATRGRKGDR